MKSNLYTLCYAAVLGAVCAGLLTAAAGIASRSVADIRIEEIANILGVLKIPIPADTSSEELVKIFKRNIRQKAINGTKVYVYTDSPLVDRAEAFAMLFSGQGYHGTIKGMLALESDMKTIRGIIFYQHQETPGMGGEITLEWFTEQFAGKSIVGENGMIGIIVGKNGSDLPNRVDAITAATITSKAVETMVNDLVRTILRK